MLEEQLYNVPNMSLDLLCNTTEQFHSDLVPTTSSVSNQELEVCARVCARVFPYASAASRSPVAYERRREPPTSSVGARDSNFTACAPRRSLGAQCLGLAHQAATSCETWRASSPSRPGSISDVRARADARSTRVESFFADGRTRIEKRGKP